MQERPDNERRRIELSGVQVVASALAAVSSAFLLSKLGAAGTVIGAAIASVVATVGSAVYVHVFRRTGDQLRDVRAQIGPDGASGAAAPGAAPAAAPVPGADDATRVLPVFDPAHPEFADPAPGPTVPVPQPSRTRPWLVRSIVGAVAVFALTMGTITALELGMGRSFASLFGSGGDRPSVTDVFRHDGGGGDPTPKEKEQKEKQDEGTPTPGTQSPAPDAGKPSQEPTGKPDPTDTPQPPTGTPTPTPTPSTQPPSSTPPPTQGGTPTGQSGSGGTAGAEGQQGSAEGAAT
ncbi:hypothetical protein [Yinghuangia soli]|uniref:Uncharacterized protein n=1 Tax=Yinghuangia soli TaxID=2908204 RepID=A0AA41PV83_9ACTN|nr:hypothetical protein [Yinghuangia soli]MCF2526383.1 hypothetical protein [Yinghuangia soli]